MKKLLVAMLVLILVAGCSGILSEKNGAIAQQRSLSPFKSIILNGDATVELANGMYAVHLTGSEKNLYKCQVAVTNQVLHIYATSLVAVKVFVPKLKNMVVADNVTLNSKNFKTNDLTIIAKGNGTINFNGLFNIDEICQRGSGVISINWVSSDNLLIDSNSEGPIYLAGITNNILAKLTHDAQIDARYLRAKKASIVATDRAQAKIWALDTLKAFAVDSSDIYYYKKPRILTIVTRGYGNVLRPTLIH